MEEAEDRVWHIHMLEPPYCESCTTQSHETLEQSRVRAESYAKQLKGVVIGPFDFSFESCYHRISSYKEVTEKEREEYSTAIDEWIPEPGMQIKPGYKGAYHIHTDGTPTGGKAWCCSVQTRADAEDMTRRREREGYENVRIIGPVDYPAINCHYYHERERERRRRRLRLAASTA